MLDQWTQWMDAAGTVLEALLLCRVLLLRLFRPYTFITLYCVLSVLFDSLSWSQGWTTGAAQHAAIIQPFFLAFLAPFTAWEAFEEIATQVAKVRRSQLGRLISGVLLTLVLLLLTFASSDVPDDGWASAAIIGLVCLLGFASASLAFLWFSWRSIRAEKIGLTNNTVVWIVFFMGNNLLAVVNCFLVMLPESVRAISETGILVLQGLDIALVCWCIYKLKRSANLVSTVFGE
jgi:hypothetical protein